MRSLHTSVSVSQHLALALVLSLGSLTAAEYVSDPAVANGGSGSLADPWPGLESCVAAGNLRRLKPGDTLYLKSGYHGAPSISGVNDGVITIAAAPSQEARLSRLTIDSAVGWHIKDLRLSPTFATPSATYQGHILSLADRGENSGQIIIEGCEVFAVDDHSSLDVKQWMGLNSGILMGRFGKGSIVKNCYIRNTRHALELAAFDGTAEGNIIQNSSGDGIRMMRDGQRCEYNIIKGAFATDSEGDKNHDDGIQCFLFNKGTGTMRNLIINHNILLGHEPGVEPHSANNQGIGLFDGPLVNFHIEGNVVMVSHWHGISAFDAQDSTIINNVTWSKFSGKMKPWVMLGNKLKQAKNNTVTGNYATAFKLGEPGTTETDNKIVTQAIYEQALNDLATIVCERYGLYHVASKRHRLTGAVVDNIPDQNSKEKGPSRPKLTSAREPASVKKPVAGAKERFQDLLQTRLDSLLSSGPRRFTSRSLGEEVTVTQRTGAMYEVEIPSMGSRMTLALFANLALEDAASLAKGCLIPGDEQGNAIAAFYCFLTKQPIDGQNYLNLAGEHKDLVLAAFETANDQ